MAPNSEQKINKYKTELAKDKINSDEVGRLTLYDDVRRENEINNKDRKINRYYKKKTTFVVGSYGINE